MIRTLTDRDVPAAMRLKDAAGWNQTEADWRRLLALAPDSSFAIDCDGVLAATGAVVCYGTDLAWIGMILTAPEYRGRGFASRILARCLEWVDARRIRWAKLDATDMGAPLYRSLGFSAECAVERWRRERAPSTGGTLGNWVADPSSDHAVFGADRTALLVRLAACGAASVDGRSWAMGREGSIAAYFGPCVCRPEDARPLLAWHLARHSGEAVFWDLFPDNPTAVALAREYGFQPVRRLMRMARPGPAPGAPIENRCADIFAIAGFEYG